MRIYRSNSHGRYQYQQTLCQALDNVKRGRDRFVNRPQHDNEYDASSFLTSLVNSAIQLRPRLDRMESVRLLETANSPVTIESLESRYWVRFILGWLHVPHGIRMELLRSRRTNQHASPSMDHIDAPITPNAKEPSPAQPPKTVLTKEDDAALRLLVAAINDNSPTCWLCEVDFATLHQNHTIAHVRTPSVTSLIDSSIITPYRHEDSDGYLLNLGNWRQDVSSGTIIPRVLGLYWEELLRDQAFASDHARVQRWVSIAMETHAIVDAPEHINPDQRQRLLNALLSLVLNDPDLAQTIICEGERLRWEFDGCFRGNLNLNPIDGSSSDLLALYKWWNQPTFAYLALRLDPIDSLIALVTLHDDVPSATRTLQILQASKARPYLMHAVHSLLERSAPQHIVALISNFETAPLGMQLLSTLEIPESPSDAWQEFAIRHEDSEKVRTALWQSGLDIFLGTLPDAPDDERAHVVFQVLLLAAKATIAPSRFVQAPPSHGPEDRFRELLAALRETQQMFLFPLAQQIHQFLKDCALAAFLKHPDLQSLPIAEMKILFWLLRITLESANGAGIDSLTVAHTILEIYCSELDRQTTSTRVVVCWLDDAPNALHLAWLDLVIALHRSQKANEFIAPLQVSLDSYIKTVPAFAKQLGTDKDSETSRSLFRSWLHKLRLHTRILIAIHESARLGAFKPAINISSGERASLLALIEERLIEIVKCFAANEPITGRPSMFEMDREFVIARTTPSDQPLPEVLVRAFNRFSFERQILAFTSWINVEAHPSVLLTIIRDALPFASQQLATTRLEGINIEQFIDQQFWLPNLQQVAEMANVTGKTEIVQKVLEYGDSRLKGHVKRAEWELFAYRMRLMLAYQKGEPDGIQNVPRPPNEDKFRSNVNGSVRDPVEESKLFYEGLSVLKADPAKARIIFDDLIHRRPGVGADIINRFAAATLVAQKLTVGGERRNAFLQALHDWEAIASTSALSDPGSHSLYTKLVCYDGAELDDEFDAYWSKLDIDKRAGIDYVALAVQNATRRGLSDRIPEFLGEAKPFHLEASGVASPRFKELERDAIAGTAVAASPTPSLNQRSDFVELLRKMFLELCASDAPTVAEVIGGPDRQPHEFLWENLVAVAKEFLLRNSFFTRELNENNYNDILVSLFRMRLDLIGWQIVDQSRGGQSATGHDAGERDLVIRNKNGELAIIEALCLDSLKSDYINKHVDKAVFNYNPIDLPHIYIVVYYNGGDLGEFWTRYLSHVTMRPLSNGLLPIQPTVPVGIGYSNSIRAALLIYKREGEPLYLYHLVIDVT